jgi:hypothetical protein
MAVSDSYGFIAVVSHPGKVKKWSATAGRTANVHGIELLPNGNVAAAASSGGWVRVCTASQGPSSSTYAQYNPFPTHTVFYGIHSGRSCGRLEGRPTTCERVLIRLFTEHGSGTPTISEECNEERLGQIQLARNITASPAIL